MSAADSTLSRNALLYKVAHLEAENHLLRAMIKVSSSRYPSPTVRTTLFLRKLGIDVVLEMGDDGLVVPVAVLPDTRRLSVREIVEEMVAALTEGVGASN